MFSNTQMNRQIKFRQFVNDMWHYWGFMENGNFISPMVSQNGTYHAAMNQSGQFTNLLDRNGICIYEGDILAPQKERRGVWECISKDGRFELTPHGGYGTKNQAIINFKHLEIIGNIYENKNLIK